MRVRSTRGAIRPRAAAALLLLAGCEIGAPSRVDVPADSAAGEVAFRLVGPGEAALVVPVHINGRGPFQLVLDTGATITCLDESLARELGLPRERGMRGMGAGVGGAGQVELFQVDSLRVGAAQAHDLTVCSIDMSHIARISPEMRGLLGLNVLKQFRVTLDFERNVVRFEGT